MEAAHNFYVYAWLRPCGTPFYIGKGHASRATSTSGRSALFNKIVSKIDREGGEPTVIKLIENLSEEEAFLAERSEISKYGRLSNGTGVLANLTDGGEGLSGHIQSADTIAKRTSKTTGMRRTAETRAKMSAWQIGRKMSDEAKSNMSVARVGRKLSDQHKAKLSAAGMGHVVSAETREKIGRATAGKQVSEETRRLLSTAHTGRRLSAAHISAMKSSQRFNPPQSNNKSGYKGVSFSGAMKKWSAEISVDGSRSKLGYFPDVDDAARAYDAAAFEAWGADCYLNFPIELVRPAANDNDPRGQLMEAA